MGPGVRRPATQVSRLIDAGLANSGIPSRRKLEELCGLSEGYITHLIDGRLRRPREEALRCIAHHLGQQVEAYRVALMADHGELPSPEYYFRGLGIPIDEKTAETVMRFVRDLTQNLVDEPEHDNAD